jgi:hypothetical protein
MAGAAGLLRTSTSALFNLLFGMDGSRAIPRCNGGDMKPKSAQNFGLLRPGRPSIKSFHFRGSSSVDRARRSQRRGRRFDPDLLHQPSPRETSPKDVLPRLGAGGRSSRVCKASAGRPIFFWQLKEYRLPCLGEGGQSRADGDWASHLHPVRRQGIQSGPKNPIFSPPLPAWPTRFNIVAILPPTLLLQPAFTGEN